MFVIAGLGNPGREYRDTRHNAGFLALEAVSRITGIKARGFRYRGRTGKGRFQGRELQLLKPRTYMNLSGLSVAACLKSLKLGPESLIVIHDDLDLPAGRIKVKARGGAGGHRGIESILEALGDDRFVRIKIGIGKPGPGEEAADYVLSPFSPEEREAALSAIELGARAALCVVHEGAAAAMNKFNPTKQEGGH